MSIARQADMDQLSLERDLIAQGMDPVQAEREAAMAILRDKQAQARAGMPRTADGRPALGAQEAAFDSDMAMAMGQDVSYGNGADVDNLAAASTPIEMDAGLGRTPVPQSARVYRDDPTQGLAGVLAAREAEAARNWEERAGQYGNPDPAARGLVETYNPKTGAVGYSVRYPEDTETALGGPGRPGRRPDLSAPVVDTATGQPIPGTHKYVRQVVQGPGGDVAVYAPSPEFQSELQERALRRQTQLLATRAGFDPMTAAAMATSDKPPNLDQLRAQGDARRAADLAARQEAVVRRRMAQTNPLEYMNRDDISDWNRMVAADSMLRRGYRGATPLDVEQAAETALALREQRLATGEGFQPRSPQEQELMQQKIDSQKPVAVRAQEHAARGRLNHPDVAQYADDIVHQHYSSRPGVLGTSSYFTDKEVTLAAERLSRDLGIPLEQALPIMKRIQEDRSRYSVASGIVSGFYDQ